MPQHLSYDTFSSHTKPIEASSRGVSADLGIIRDTGGMAQP